MLRYQDFLRRAVEESIKGATQSYGHRDDSKGKAMLEGAVAGLKACLDKSPPQLAELLMRARTVQHKAFHQTVLERYWRVNCFMAEVEWICNIISVALVNQGVPAIVEPTMRAALMADRISKEESINTN